MEDCIKNKVNQKREEIRKIAEKYGIEEEKVFVYTCIIYKKIRGNIDNILIEIEEIFKKVNEIKTSEFYFSVNKGVINTSEKRIYLNEEYNISKFMDILARFWRISSLLQKDVLALKVAGNKYLKFQILMDNYGYVEEELLKYMDKKQKYVTNLDGSDKQKN